MRVLVVCHAHPELATGGAQLMAHRVHASLCKDVGIDSYFVAWAPPRKTRLASFSSHGRDGREILFHGGTLHPFLHSQEESWFVTHDFRELLQRINPDVVHFHHYAGVGIDLIREIKNWSRKVPVVLTLHEFLAICHNRGTMVKTGGQDELCLRADPRACANCFPDQTPEDFFLRELFLKSYFELVDQFVAPSHFLKSRYVDWGLPESKFEVVVEGQPHASMPRRRRPSDPVHFAFLGKVFRIKGIFVLLDAIELLSPEVREQCRFSIYGNGIEEESYSVRSSYESRLGALRGTVRSNGHYGSEDVPQILADLDWLIMPSIWWENAPLVIQEAFVSGVPVIASNIGGMAEKVRDGIDGLLFRANDPRDLARVIATAVTTKGLRDKLAGGVRPPPTVKEMTEWYLRIYERLLGERSSVPASAEELPTSPN